MVHRLAAAVTIVANAACAIASSIHDHSIKKSLPGSWYQPDDHSAHALFKRGGATDGITYATVGSPEWYNAYPPGVADPSTYPKAWVDALNAAVSAGKIPDIPVSTSVMGLDPVYPTGYDPNGATVCSATYKCFVPDDVWNAPDGVIGISFDDGPLPPSKTLYDFLGNNSVRATHFYIGTNILNNYDAFNTAFNVLQDDIALHTWTHPYMTTLTNEQLLGEFGWTMEIIHNSTGGRLPKYWRPPYGDADNRVRAIAKEIFGLTTVIWNQDTDDWMLTEGPGTTPDQVHSLMTQWLTGPKNPGLVILEHELSDLSVQSFIDAFPLMKSNGWNLVSLTEMSGGPTYQNAQSSASSVTPAQIGDKVTAPPKPSSSSPPNATGGHQGLPQGKGSASQGKKNGAVSTARAGPLPWILACGSAALAAAASSLLA